MILLDLNQVFSLPESIIICESSKETYPPHYYDIQDSSLYFYLQYHSRKKLSRKFFLTPFESAMYRKRKRKMKNWTVTLRYGS